MLSRAPIRARDAEFRAHPTLGSNRPEFRKRVAIWWKLRLLWAYRVLIRRPSVVQLLSVFLALVFLVIIAVRAPVYGPEFACSGPHCGNLSFKDSLIPLLQNRGYESTWLAENQRQLGALFRCVDLDLCGPNQAKVVIITMDVFKPYYSKPGEQDLSDDIWAQSIIEALRNKGYTYLFAEQNDRAQQIYQFFPSLVTAIFMSPTGTDSCFHSTACIMSTEHPDGFPAWKLFSLSKAAGAKHPLGAAWTLLLEDPALPQIRAQTLATYLGYSFESMCYRYRFMPHDLRLRRAFIDARQLSNNILAAEQPDRAWELNTYDAAARASEIQFAAAFNFSQKGGAPQLPTSFVALHPLSQDEVIKEISQSLVLVGTGITAASPMPYQALCLGVPYINPIQKWLKSDPNNREKWVSQHEVLKYLDPPFVYNVRHDDNAGFINAIKNVTETPIERFIPPNMKMAALEDRLSTILEIDWRSRAEALLEERTRTKSGQIFAI